MPESKEPDPALVAELAAALTREEMEHRAKAKPALDLTAPSILDRVPRDEPIAIIDEIRRHFHAEIRWLAKERGIDPDVGRRMVRVEMTYDAKTAVLSGDYMRYQYAGHHHIRPGPMQIDGVDCYVVRELPPEEKGWRVINPMKAERKR